MLGCSDSSKPARCRSAAMQWYPLVRIALSVRRIVIIVLFIRKGYAQSQQACCITRTHDCNERTVDCNKRSDDCNKLSDDHDEAPCGPVRICAKAAGRRHGLGGRDAAGAVSGLPLARRQDRAGLCEGARRRSAKGEAPSTAQRATLDARGLPRHVLHMGHAVRRSAHHGNESGEHDCDNNNLYTRLLRST